MLAKRIIPCLDIKDGRVVKGKKFIDLIDQGDPVKQSQKYNTSLADELVFLDINATVESRNTMKETVRAVAENVFIPLTVGGGIKEIKDVERLLLSGADKVAINSAAVKNPPLITEIAKRYGSQCAVVSIDVKKEGTKWRVYTHGGKISTDLFLRDWVKEVVSLGAGELLITCIDRDGLQNGFDIDLYQSISDLRVPVIASGGAGKMNDFLDLFQSTNVTGALAASIFHQDIVDIKNLKLYLIDKGVKVRI
ncbi:MAG: imidazole glycerol phosphate synthase subunit HisF [Clostridia bacterium]